MRLEGFEPTIAASERPAGSDETFETNVCAALLALVVSLLDSRAVYCFHFFFSIDVLGVQIFSCRRRPVQTESAFGEGAHWLCFYGPESPTSAFRFKCTSDVSYNAW